MGVWVGDERGAWAWLHQPGQGREGGREGRREGTYLCLGGQEGGRNRGLAGSAIAVYVYMQWVCVCMYVNVGRCVYICNGCVCVCRYVNVCRCMYVNACMCMCMYVCV